MSARARYHPWFRDADPLREFIKAAVVAYLERDESWEEKRWRLLLESVGGDLHSDGGPR